MKLYFLLFKGNSNACVMWKVSDDGDFSVVGKVTCT